MLSKIVQDSVNKIENKYEHHNSFCEIFEESETCDCKQSDMRKDLISSQISLLEAELGRNKSGLSLLAIDPTGVCGFTSQEEIKAYTLAIKDNIRYLTEQIEEIKKLIHETI